VYKKFGVRSFSYHADHVNYAVLKHDHQVLYDLVDFMLGLVKTVVVVGVKMLFTSHWNKLFNREIWGKLGNFISRQL